MKKTILFSLLAITALIIAGCASGEAIRVSRPVLAQPSGYNSEAVLGLLNRCEGVNLVDASQGYLSGNQMCWQIGKKCVASMIYWLDPANPSTGLRTQFVGCNQAAMNDNSATALCCSP